MFPRHRLHARADALIGMGSWAPAWNHQNQVHIDFFGVVEPRVALEFRVTRAIQVAGFAAYRMPFGGGELARELRGPELGLNVRLGWF